MLVLVSKFWTYLLISTFFSFIMLHSCLNATSCLVSFFIMPHSCLNASHMLQQYNVKGQNNIQQEKNTE